eukprot:6183223-Pleurochrysis_carterae.AAC.1
MPPCMCMRKSKGMLVVCPQQEAQRRQAYFSYRPRATWPCGNAMKPVGARPGEQARGHYWPVYITANACSHDRTRVMRSSGSSFHLGVARFKVTREDWAKRLPKRARTKPLPSCASCKSLCHLLFLLLLLMVRLYTPFGCHDTTLRATRLTRLPRDSRLPVKYFHKIPS